jgi:hypothetical protein
VTDGPLELLRNRYDYEVAAVHKIVDGDTYDLTLSKPTESPGFNVAGTFTYRARFRLLGIDTWERNSPEGQAAMRAASLWLVDHKGKGWLRGTTHKPDATPLPDGAFGRWLIDLYDDLTGEHLSDWLRTQGHEKVRP